MYEQLKQRMGVVIVGPPQTGKSTVCAILKKVLIVNLLFIVVLSDGVEGMLSEVHLF